MPTRTSVRPTGADIAGAIGHLAWTLLIVIGAPWALVTFFGWPLPTAMPDWSDAASTPIQLVEPVVILNVFVCLAWICWATVMVYVALDVIDLARGVGQRAHRLGPFNVVAGRLIASTALLAGLARPSVASSEALPPAPAVQVVDTPPAAAAPLPESVGNPVATSVLLEVPAQAETRPTPTYVVQRGNCLWDIAEQQLRDGFRWQEIYDLNRDFISDPDYIEVGWTLTLPADAVADVPPADAMPTTDVPDPPVEANGGPQPMPDPAPADEPDAVPPADTDAPTTSTVQTVPETAPSERAPVTVPSMHQRPPSTVHPPDEATDDQLPVPVVPAAVGFASAALAVGATRAVRRRRQQAAHRAATRRPAPTAERLEPLHRELAAAADTVLIEDLRHVLSDLAVAIAETGGTARPRIIQLSGGRVEVLVDRSGSNPPEGWTAEADGSIWTLQAASRDPGDEWGCAAPLVVTLGHPDDADVTLLDLEAERLVALDGDPDAARGAARAMLTELALSPLTDTLQVIVVGDLAPPAAKALDHVQLAASWDEVAADLADWAEQTRCALEANGWPNTFVGRGHAPHHDALAPLVVVADKPPPGELLDQLVAHPKATLAVVALGAYDGATTIMCTTECVRIEELGLECEPYVLESVALDAIIDLIEAADADVEGSDEAEQLALPDISVVPGPEAGMLEEPDYDILVRVLGEIRVDGGEPLAAKQTAVATYIALHKAVTSDRLADAVWGGTTSPSRRKRLANTISECRAALGQRHFPPMADGRYVSGPGLATDLDLFDIRIRRAVDQPPNAAADTLRSALDLVTGPLFTYRNNDRASFTWVDLENWVSKWELKVAAVAQRCTELLLDQGRGEEAVEVACRALDAMPTHTALTETLMRVHAASGDRVAVQRVYDQHVRALHSLDLDDPDESTVVLSQRLVDQRRA